MSYKHRGVLNSKEVPAETRDAVTSSALSDLEVLWKKSSKTQAEVCRELQVVPPWRVGPAARGGQHSAGEHAVVPPGGKAV